MGNTDGIIRLFRNMKMLLLITATMSTSLFFYVFFEGMIGLSIMAGVLAFAVVAHELPAPKEIRQTLKQKDNILNDDKIVWYVIESKEDGNIRVM